MEQKGPIRPESSRWTLLLALLCVVLALVAGTAQAVHVHADGPSSHADCSLCVAAHASIQTVAAHTLTAPVAVPARADLAAEPRRASETPVFALFTRPPPAA